MAENKEKQFEQWLKNRSTEKTKDDPVDQTPSASPESTLPQLDTSDEPVQDSRYLSPPLLSGKLADYLATKKPREFKKKPERLISENVPITIEDNEVRAAVAMSVILASHLTRFASTTISENALLHFREQILKTFGAHDAVLLEIEAYDLLKWFAGAMNEEWMFSSPEMPQNEEQGLLDHIAVLQRAIDEKLDLDMSYYTGARGEFSTRRITPIEIDAEKYLIAYCHTRKENRRFRLSRILSLNWVKSKQASLFDGMEHKAVEASPVAQETSETLARNTANEENEFTSALKQDEQAPTNTDQMDKVSASSPKNNATAANEEALNTAWIPDSQVENARKKRSEKRENQPMLPGVQPNESKTEKQSKKDSPKTTGFLPGFE